MSVRLAILSLFLPSGALGQAALSDSTHTLDEIVISANKMPELRTKVSQQVHVIPHTQIVSSNPQTTADLIASTGTVAVQKSQQGGGSPQIRGFEASRVLLVIDGVRMNNLIYRAGHLQNVITVDNNVLERAEILFGPSSTVYGSDALGGVIHLTTKDPVLSPQGNPTFSGNTMLRYGTVNNEKTAHVDFNIAKGNFASLSSITVSDFDDLKMGKKINPAYGESFGLRRYYTARSDDNSSDVLVPNSNPHIQKFSGYSQYDILQKLLFAPGEQAVHELNLQFSTSSRIPRYDRLTDPEGTGLRNAEWYYGPQERFMAAYDVTVTNVGRMADVLNTTLSYQKINESRHTRRFNAIERRSQIEDVDVWALIADFQKSWTTHKIRYGLDAQFSQVNSRAFATNVVNNERARAATRYPDGQNYIHHYALYITHTADVNDRFNLSSGARIGLSRLKAEFNDKTFFDFPFDEVNQTNRYASGSMGMVFRPKEDWKFSLMGSTGFRVPNIDDLGKVFDTRAGESLIVPNPGIRPEKTINFDLSLSRIFAERVRWENTLFYTFLFDAIIQDDFTFNGQSEINFEGRRTRVIANQNKRAAFITGITSVLHGDLSDQFSVDASFTYTRGRIKAASGQTPLDHIPPAFGRVGLEYHPKKISAEMFVNFSGWKRIEDYLLNSEDNEVYATPLGTPAWYTINLRLAYQLTSAIRFQAGIDNALDLQYRTFSSGINAPGRNIFLVVRLAI